MERPMASEIERERILGNFKPSRSARLREKRNRDPRAKREGNSAKHLAAIRKLPCCVPGCTTVGCDPHHLKSGSAADERGMQLRATDRYAVPLCRHHHDEVERIGSRNERRWFGALDAIELAGALWSATPNAAQMTKIVLAHKGGNRGMKP